MIVNSEPAESGAGTQNDSLVETLIAMTAIHELERD
jgi:hypothetical protein